MGPLPHGTSRVPPLSQSLGWTHAELVFNIVLLSDPIHQRLTIKILILDKGNFFLTASSNLLSYDNLEHEFIGFM